jgi:hypothetical protein
MNKQFYKATSLKYGTTNIVKVMLGTKLVYPVVRPIRHYLGTVVTVHPRTQANPGVVDVVQVGDRFEVQRADLADVFAVYVGDRMDRAIRAGSIEDGIIGGYVKLVSGPAGVVRSATFNYTNAVFQMTTFDNAPLTTKWVFEILKPASVWMGVAGFNDYGTGNLETDTTNYIDGLMRF